MIKLIVIRDTFNLNPITRTGEDITELMRAEFGDQLPSGAVFYIDEVVANTGFAVHTADDVARLKSASLVYCVIEPQGIETLIAIGIGALISVAATFLLAPKLPETGGSTAAPSPNQGLSRRTNQERLGGRVPDNFGRVLTIPDLLAPTYPVYIDNQEVEFSYLCIGNGKHEVHGVSESGTPFDQLSGANCRVYDPGVSIDDTPSFEVGQPYTAEEEALSRLFARRCNAVTGQELSPPDSYLVSENDVRFLAPNIINIEDEELNFLTEFAVGDSIQIEGAGEVESDNLTFDHDADVETPEIPVTYNLNGTFIVAEVSDKQVKLVDPGSTSAGWQELADNSDQTKLASPVLSSESQNLFEGFFYTDQPGATCVFGSVLGLNGLYIGSKDKADMFAPLKVLYEVELQAVDANKNPIAGTLETHEFTITGRLFDQNASVDFRGNYKYENEIRATAAQTFKIDTPIAERCRIRIRRITNQIRDSKRAVSDKLQIRDLFSAKRLSGDREAVFDDVMVVTAMQRATEAALRGKERQLKVDCTRYVNCIDGSFAPSELAPDILYHVATDPKIGRLSPAQVDTDSISAEFDAHAEYFGSDLFQRISLTLSDTNESAETTIARIAFLCFGYCYYFANQMRFYFERPVPAPAVIFTSYNTAPRSIVKESATGVDNERDGVEVTYIDNTDGLQRSLIYPLDAINAEKIDLTGCANETQATAHMMRRYQKLMYQRTRVTGEFLDESNVLVRGNAVICSDNAQDVAVQSGEVVSIDSATMIMRLSQPVVLAEGENHSLRVQLINAAVDSIPISAGPDETSVTLERMPSGALSFYDDGNVVSASYDVVSSTDLQRHWYLTEKVDPVGVNSNEVEMTNYDERYYEHDRDHLIA